ncbi:MAG: DGQHR domain-containing protein [Gammaproteobacteria bacterium]|nr:DGQHR domain-containing protein [Gammaproteobacteria bacterium]
MKWKSVKFKQNNTVGYMVNVKASEVQNLVGIDQKTSSNKNGYQRPQSPSRVKSFQKFMQSEFCPVPLVANIRVADGKISYNDKTGILTIDNKLSSEGPIIWICEGQHRYWGYIGLYEENEVDVDIPFVLVNESREWEIANFYVINKKQRAIPTDLAEIAAMAYQESTGREISGVSIADTRKMAIKLAEKLNSSPRSPFYNRIQITGNHVVSTIKANSFHVAIEEVIKASQKVWPDEVLVAKNAEKLIVNAWKAIFEMMPDATRGEDHKKYVVLKTAGIFVFNRIIAETVDSLNNFNMTTQDDYYKLFTSEDMRNFMYDDWWSVKGDPSSNIPTAIEYGSSQGSFRRILQKMMVGMNTAIQKRVKTILTERP